MIARIFPQQSEKWVLNLVDSLHEYINEKVHRGVQPPMFEVSSGPYIDCLYELFSLIVTGSFISSYGSKACKKV